MENKIISILRRCLRWLRRCWHLLTEGQYHFLILSLKPKESIAKKGFPLNKPLLQIGQLQAKRRNSQAPLRSACSNSLRS
ncbi:MAG: hypothetical protein MJZ72_06830 [Bacteroidales bacterium]|nr:hypothetical protein [Bacteroidales bacterium]